MRTISIRLPELSKSTFVVSIYDSGLNNCLTFMSKMTGALFKPSFSVSQNVRPSLTSFFVVNLLVVLMNFKGCMVKKSWCTFSRTLKSKSTGKYLAGKIIVIINSNVLYKEDKPKVCDSCVRLSPSIAMPTPINTALPVKRQVSKSVWSISEPYIFIVSSSVLNILSDCWTRRTTPVQVCILHSQPSERLLSSHLRLKPSGAIAA
jgi:hypothetical protein